MKKFTSILKVLTFINLEIFLLCGLMVASIIYGHKYLESSTKSVETITTSLKQNDLEKLLMNKTINSFKELDNQLLNKSLKNLDITEDLDLLSSYRDSFKLDQNQYEKFDSMLIDKSILFRVIKTYKKSTKITIEKEDFVRTTIVKDFLPKKTIVSRKNVFGKYKTDTIITVDTVERVVQSFDSESFQSDRTLSEKVDYNSFQNYIYNNNDLTVKIGSLLNETILHHNKNVSKSQSELISKLNNNLQDYFKIITILVSVFFFTLLLLIRDLKKKSQKEYRDKYLISMILNKKD